ncbi:hypothetical protein HELRODRAFT_174159 [Helobdella robusta]|uniref:Uncharacterized protein n=1 Tax=Helobdella robusta TaxID=6412 RepID=T1F7P6_HELRO|nr:hypothetical protein HELRODRAFT_174159 [Helobdella robusta]ESO02754.1 hypothetical protein HELRODRAFT_174159 [Helobdella robusta]
MVVGDGSLLGTKEFVNRNLTSSSPGTNYVVFLRVATSDAQNYSSDYSQPLFGGHFDPVTYVTYPLLKTTPRTFQRTSTVLPTPTSSFLSFVESIPSPGMESKYVGNEKDVVGGGGSPASVAAPLCVTLLFMFLLVGLFFFARKRRYAFEWMLPEPWKLILPTNDIPSFCQIDPQMFLNNKDKDEKICELDQFDYTTKIDNKLQQMLNVTTEFLNLCLKYFFVCFSTYGI